MLAATLLSATLGILTLAQASPVLGTGPCLDSSRAVPLALQPPVVRNMQVVRIDRVESTATMMPGEVIGFLYTLEDGSTWLGQRTADFMSPADAASVNQVLASTHLPSITVSQFPPQTKFGVATKYQQFFPVRIPPTALATLRIQIAPCVAWPAGQNLPDPTM